MKVLVTSNDSNDMAISDILYVVRDNKMWLNEKKFYINTIDLLHKLGYYQSSNNDSEKVSLFKDNR